MIRIHIFQFSLKNTEVGEFRTLHRLLFPDYKENYVLKSKINGKLIYVRLHFSHEFISYNDRFFTPHAGYSAKLRGVSERRI